MASAGRPGTARRPTSALVLRGTAWAFALQNLSVPFLLAGSIYLLRSLAVEQYGVLAILLALNLYLTVLAHLGVTAAIGRYVPEYRSRDNHVAVRRLIASAYVLRFLTLAVLLVPAVALIEPIARVLHVPDLPRYFPLFCVYIAADVGVQTAAAVLDSRLKQAVLNGARFLHAVAKLGLFVLLIRPGSALGDAVLALVLAHLGLLAVLLVAAWLAVRDGRGGEWPRSERTRVARYALPAWSGKLSFLVFDVSTDVYLVSYFLGPGAAGLYSFAYNAASQLVALAPSTSLWSSLVPAAVEARHDRGLLAVVFRLASKLLLFFLVPMAAVVGVLSGEIIAVVVGDPYVPAAGVLVIWLVILGLRELEQPARMMLVVRERAWGLILNRILVVVNLLAAVVLIPRLGIVGAAVASGATTALGVLITVTVARAVQPASYPWVSSGRLLLNGAACVVLATLVQPYVVDPSGLALGLLILIVAYLAATALNTPFDRGDLEVLQRALPRATPALAWLAPRAARERPASFS